MFWRTFKKSSQKVNSKIKGRLNVVDRKIPP